MQADPTPTTPAPSSIAGDACSPNVPVVTPKPDMFIAGKEFHLKEYESLRKEMGELVEHSRKLEIYALGGIAAFYAWYLTSTSLRLPKELLWIPVFLAMLGALRSWSVYNRLMDIAKYLRQVEKCLTLKDCDLIGWETHLKLPKNESSPFLSSAAIFWLVLVLISLLAKLRL